MSKRHVHIPTGGAHGCPPVKASDGTLHLCPFMNAFSGSLLIKISWQSMRIVYDPHRQSFFCTVVFACDLRDPLLPSSSAPPSSSCLPGLTFMFLFSLPPTHPLILFPLLLLYLFFFPPPLSSSSFSSFFLSPSNSFPLSVSPSHPLLLYFLSSIFSFFFLLH